MEGRRDRRRRPGEPAQEPRSGGGEIGAERVDTVGAVGRVDHGDAQAGLVADDVVAADALHQRLQRGAAAHGDVLAVVELDAVLGVAEGEGLAADERAAFDQECGQPRLRQVQGGGETGQAAADHGDRGVGVGHGLRRALGRAAKVQSSSRRRTRPVREGLTRSLQTS